MARIQRVRVDIVDTVWMEEAGLRAVQDCLFAGRIGEAEDAPAVYSQPRLF